MTHRSMLQQSLDDADPSSFEIFKTQHSNYSPAILPASSSESWLLKVVDLPRIFIFGLQLFPEISMVMYEKWHLEPFFLDGIATISRGISLNSRERSFSLGVTLFFGLETKEVSFSFAILSSL